MLPGAGGRDCLTVRAALLVATYVPEIVTAVGSVTFNAVTVKFALNWPAGTITVFGTVAAPVLLLESVTVMPPVAAGWPSVTVP